MCQGYEWGEWLFIKQELLRSQLATLFNAALHRREDKCIATNLEYRVLVDAGIRC
jgi:hypothetical protein